MALRRNRLTNDDAEYDEANEGDDFDGRKPELKFAEYPDAQAVDAHNCERAA